METIVDILKFIENKIVWSPLLIVILFGTGLYLTVRLRFMTIRRIPTAIMLAIKNKTEGQDKGEISPRAALFTALSATVGTGNIAGVATAIAIGGPGAIFWMWMTAILGMATKYSEALLAIKFRETDKNGNTVGGPMYYIKNGLGKKWKWLAFAFAILTSFAAIGTGNMIQAYEVTNVLYSNTNFLEPWTIGLILSIFVFFVIIGGIKSIASIASKLVPLMAIAYFICAVTIIILNMERVPYAFEMIFTDAFTGTAAVGGFIGAHFFLVIQHGADRGSFSNEAGLGSAAIAHASAKTHDATRQGTIAMLGCFIDTIIVCTLTALVILTAPPIFEYAGKVQQHIFASDIGVLGRSTGAELTSKAFSSGLAQIGINGGQWIVVIGLIVFAFTTILGWALYGERSIEFLFGKKIIIPYRILWCFAVFSGALLVYTKEGSGQKIAWSIASICNGLMAWPNLIGVLLLSGTIIRVSYTSGIIGNKKTKE